MTPLAYIFIGLGLILALFLSAKFIKPTYSVTQRLGSVQLASNLNSIRISTVIIKRSGKHRQKEKGLFVLGTVRGGAYIDHSESLFPITEQELDEVITLLKTQPVFSVTWKKKPPITLSINGPAEEAQLIFDKFTWVDSTFKADIDDAGMKRLLKNFEALKKETDHAQISA